MAIKVSGTTVIDDSRNATFANITTTGTNPSEIAKYSADATSGILQFTKSRNATVGAHTVVQDGDDIGILRFNASDGTNFVTAASILGEVDGAPASNDMPGRLGFYTTQDGTTTLTERMRIDNQGRVTIGGTSFDGVGSLRARRNLTGSNFTYGIISDGVVQTDSTSGAFYFRSTAGTVANAAPYTVTSLLHYSAEQGTFGANTNITTQIGYGVGATLTGATNNFGFYGNLAEAAGRWNFFANGTANNQFNGSLVVSTNHAFDAVRITQAGTGNALVVEDSANPDSSPFVIDTSGRVLVGHTASTPFNFQGLSYVLGKFQLSGIDGNSSVGLFAQYSASSSNSPGIILAKSQGATVGTQTITGIHTKLGEFGFAGSDGNEFIQAAAIQAFVDGIPGANDMPGRIVFSTTLDGSNTVTERMRITNDGRVGIGSVAPTTQTLLVSRAVTGGTDQRSIEVNDTVQSGVTSQAIGFLSIKNTQAASFTLPTLDHFNAFQGTFGASSFVTTQTGFRATSSLIGGNNNIGFSGDIPAGAGRWNFWAGGTANNYFNGNVWIGVSGATEKFYVRQTDASNGTATFENSSSGGGLRGIWVRATNDNIPALQLSRLYTGFSTGNIGQIRFDGYGTGGSYVEHAAIYAYTSGTNTTNGAPSVLSFRTSSGTTSTSSIERMVITSTGNVGIGTSTPGYLLSVAGTFNTTAPVTLATGARGDAQVEVGANRISYPTGGTWDATGSTTVTITYNNHGFSDGQRVELFFANTAGTNATNGAYTVAGSATNTFTITNPSSITGSGTLRIDSIGNAYIDFIGDATYTDYGLRLIRYNGGANTGSELITRGGSLALTTQETQPVVFKTTNTERARFAATGEFLLGRTYTSNERIGIGGTTSAAAAAGIYNDTTIGTTTTTSYGSYSSFISTAAGASPYTVTNVTGYDSSFFTLGANTTITNLYGFRASGLLNVATNNYGFHSGIAEGANRWNFFAAGSANNYFAGSATIDVNNAFNGLRITQQGSGNAFIVEDSVNPDSSPFVITNSGTVIKGSTDSKSVAGLIHGLQLNGATTSDGTSISLFRYNNDTAGPQITFAKSRGNGTTAGVVQNNDTVGSLIFSGDNGANTDTISSSIVASVDGTPSGSAGVPGRIVFSTNLGTGLGTTERMRIDAAGNVNIGAFSTSISSRLTVVGQANFTDASNNTRLRVAYGTVPGFGGTAAYIVNADNSPLYLGANNTASGGVTVSSNNNVIIGGNTDTGTYKLQVIGAFGATTKSFVIDHPTKPGMKLRYASLEGPENGVYIRGRNRTGIIILPDYWAGLVDADTITVQLTPVGKQQNLYVQNVTEDAIYIGKEGNESIDCFYTVYAERKDVDKLIVEYTED